jgi:hypothetical protein
MVRKKYAEEQIIAVLKVLGGTQNRPGKGT